MRGQLRPVVDRAFAELWLPLTDHYNCPPNVFGETFAGLRRFLKDPEPEYVKADDGTIRDSSAGLDYWVSLALEDAATAEKLLVGLSGANFESESKALKAINSTYSVLCDVATLDLAKCYLDLLNAFVDRYSLRYYVDEEARFWISFPGLATALFAQVRMTVEGQPHLHKRLNAFERALAECLAALDEDRIMTVIQKQVNFLEAVGSQHREVNDDTLGRMLDEVKSWPHDSLTTSAKQIYKFASDYSGIRHGSSSDSAVRELDLRDLAGVTFSLVGLVVYLAEGFESKVGPAMQGEISSHSIGENAIAPWLPVLAIGTRAP